MRHPLSRALMPVGLGSVHVECVWVCFVWGGVTRERGELTHRCPFSLPFFAIHFGMSRQGLFVRHTYK